jgi:hypothetical protein
MIDITRRGFLASGAIATGLSAHALESADITWVSDDPISAATLLRGPGLDAATCSDRRTHPPDLSGAYMQQAEPVFKPISFTYRWTATA